MTTSEQTKSEMVSPKIVAFEHVSLGIIAVICGILVILTTSLGPLIFGQIQYKTSSSAYFQIQGADFIYLVVLAPLCIIGGIMELKSHPNSKYILILVPITLIYNALSLGIGLEWSITDYSGNSEQYFGLYLGMIIGGLILLIMVPPMFTPADVPEFKRKSLIPYTLCLIFFMGVFNMMWIGEVKEVLQFGNTRSGSYLMAPNLFWVIRYLDLGFTIPLGFIGAYLLNVKPKQSYPILMLFFGFFITMVLSVNAMGWNMWLNNDPEFQWGQLIIFGILALISFAGYLFLVQNKILKRKSSKQIP
jgi:hypothetical protein